MKHDKILEYINFVSNKHQEGLVLTPEQYNVLGNVYNQLLFQKEYDVVEIMAKQQGVSLYDALHNSTSLRQFKKVAIIELSNGEGDLPEDYVFCYSIEGNMFGVAEIGTYDKQYEGGSIKMVDIVTEGEFLKRRVDILSDIESAPIAVLSSDKVRVIPVTTIYPIEVSMEFESYSPLIGSPGYVRLTNPHISDMSDYFYEGQSVTVLGTGESSIDGVRLVDTAVSDYLDVVSSYAGAGDDATFYVSYNKEDDGVRMVYLAQPEEIYYDYCVVEDTDEVVYMPVGSYINAAGNLLDSSGTTIKAGVVHYQATSYPYYSESTEFQWEDRMMTKIMGMILEAMGVSLKDQFLYETSKLMQQ